MFRSMGNIKGISRTIYETTSSRWGSFDQMVHSICQNMFKVLCLATKLRKTNFIGITYFAFDLLLMNCAVWS